MRNDAMQLVNISQPGHVAQPVVIETHLTVDVANQLITKIIALQNLFGKPLGPRPGADNYQFLDVMTVLAQPAQVKPQ
jgi:hypothetical protein